MSVRFYILCRSLSHSVGYHRRQKPNAFSAIIFSKDRPLQLQALLQSIYFHVSGLQSLTVLYRSTTTDYKAAYQNLKIKFPAVIFYQETSFRRDIIHLLKQVSTRWVFFLVDDIIFIDTLHLKDLSCRLHTKTITSLRLHPGITYSYMRKTDQKPPAFLEVEKDILEFRWQRDGVDWAYPLSLDGHIFDTCEIVFMIKKCQFKAPNSLEAALQIFSPYIAKTKVGICFRVPKIINFPLNRVQTEFDNAAGDTNPEELLQLYNSGAEIDFLYYRGTTYNSVHVETELRIKSP